MQQRTLAGLGEVSALTLGGGGLGGVWGPTSRAEAVATVEAAVAAGINLLDLAPGYGRGEAETVVGEAFGGSLPEGVRVTTKCQLGSPPAGDVDAIVRRRLERSLEALRTDRVDLLLLHSNLIPDDYVYPRDSATQDQFATRISLFHDAVVPVFEALREEGLIGAWGITGVGLPATVIEALGSARPPAVVQVVANCLDSAGDMRRYDEPARPRDIIKAAVAAGVGVMGIRAVQAGALTDGFDRDIPEDTLDGRDFQRAAPFRALAAELAMTPALLAHRYALGIDGVATVVLGVKNRSELAECLAAEAAGPLSTELQSRVDQAVGRS
ncbi:MAG: aldo/keto reductase [Gammaproteobacteria bacterium]|nr:aldo/keto reductase [Gammaproteobacteria bacterium]